MRPFTLPGSVWAVVVVLHSTTWRGGQCFVGVCIGSVSSRLLTPPPPLSGVSLHRGCKA